MYHFSFRACPDFRTTTHGADSRFYLELEPSFSWSESQQPCHSLQLSCFLTKTLTHDA
jgi:hypothetical protein